MKDSWTSSQTEAVTIAADTYRGELVIQHTAGDPVYLGFNEPAVVGKGICLSSAAPFLQLTNILAGMSVSMVCASGKSASGGYQTV
jgi:hypothetical protein